MMKGSEIIHLDEITMAREYQDVSDDSQDQDSLGDVTQEHWRRVRHEL